MAFFAAIGHYYLLFSGIPMTVQSMTPGWLLPIFPVMLCGTLAAIIAPFQPSEHAIPILIAGLIFKGLGWMIAIFMYANYIARLMSAGLPTPSTRPGMFIAVGPPSFTALALIGMADAAIQHFPRELAVHGLDADFTPRVLKVMAVFAALFLWGLSLFFFFVSLVSVLVGVREMKFHLTWWSFVFPNTGFIIATIQIGTAIASKAVLWFATVLIVLEVCMWLFVGLAHIKAVRDGQILWPGKDEDSHY